MPCEHAPLYYLHLVTYRETLQNAPQSETQQLLFAPRLVMLERQCSHRSGTSIASCLKDSLHRQQASLQNIESMKEGYENCCLPWQTPLIPAASAVGSASTWPRADTDDRFQSCKAIVVDATLKWCNGSWIKGGGACRMWKYEALWSIETHGKYYKWRIGIRCHWNESFSWKQKRMVKFAGLLLL